MKKRWRIRMFLVLIISGVLALFAFNRTESNSRVLTGSIPLSADSVASIRKSIHADQKASLLDTLFKNRVKRTGFNGCVLVAQKGQIIYENAYGFSDLKTKDSLTLNSPFQ